MLLHTKLNKVLSTCACHYTVSFYICNQEGSDFLTNVSLCLLYFLNPLSILASQLNWLSVDFNNWKDWEDDSDEEFSNYDRFSEV